MLCKLHYGHVVADEMPQLIPMWWAISHFQMHTKHHIQELTITRTCFPMHDKGMELIYLKI